MSYSTTSRKNILQYLQENRDQTVTVSDISEHLKETDREVNVTTIYRYLDRLTKDGTVMKYVAEKGKQAVFQYVESGHNCEDHLHLKCTGCGIVIHMECHFMEEIAEHVQEHHGFSIQCKNSMIYGLCRACREKNESNAD